MTGREYFEIGDKYFSEYEKTEDYKLLEEALKSYSEAIKLQPDFADAYYKRALVNGLMDELECKYQDLNIAINIYTGLLSQDGNNPELHYKIALAHMVDYQDNKNKEKALNCFNKALELGYEKPDIFFNIGETYNQFFNTSPNEALSYYNKAIDLAPNKAEYYLARGDCYDLLEQRENAMADFSKGIELAPGNWMFYNRRGELFIQLKEWDNAIDDYKEFRKLYPFVIKPKIELLRNISGGPFFELYFAVDFNGRMPWHPDSYYLEDCIMVEFLQVFSAVKEFAFYGPNEYNSSELSILLEKLKEHLKLLNNITGYADFFAHIENTHFLNTLISKFDDIRTGWESILHQIIEITNKLIELLSNAISKGQCLSIDGI